MARSPGEPVVVRGVWRARPWIALGAIVVQDSPELLVLYTPEGAPIDCARVAPIAHPWESRTAWEGHGMLILQRPGDPYAVFVFWEGLQRTFSCWYVNFQRPLTPSRVGFDMLDHELDLWSEDGKTWHWKDDELLDLRVDDGLFTAAEAAAIRAEAKRVHADLAANGTWWDEAWARWSPDPAWGIPALAPDWREL